MTTNKIIRKMSSVIGKPKLLITRISEEIPAESLAMLSPQ